jgi:short subunit dehydrogenase-like uncharacterized protein
VAASSQTGPVAVYGATGFTGRLVAAELARHRADFLLAGRDPGKLEALSRRLGGVPTRAVAVGDPDGLRALLEPCAAVIACAGPFMRHGEPVLAAAAETGTHYVDTTGEQPFMRLVFDRYGPLAAERGAALMTAMGFDYVPGDMIAALTAAEMGPLDQLTLAYSVRGMQATRGTTLSGLDMVGGGDMEYRDGALRPASRKVDRGSFDFPPPVGRQPMIRYPGGEPITVPRHVETLNVLMLLSAETVVPGRLAGLLPMTIPAIGLAMRSPLRGLMPRLVARMPEGPRDERRSANRFTIVCEAQTGDRRRRGVVTGSDVYGLTAITTVRAALLAAAPGFEARGALAPSEAFDPGDFLGALAEHGVEHDVEPLPDPAPAPTRA